MALSLFAKLKNKYFQQFIRMWGREPQSAKEWMSIQDNAVRELNKTKGVPPGPVKPPFQGWKPEVIQGGKGIESLLKSGDVKKGVAPKTTKETLKAKKDKHILLRDSEEGIARIKRENKQAIEDFKKKHGKKTVEDFRDEGDFDPGGMASGGRIAMAGGGALKKFIEQLFIKASNDIRLGRGKWKGLDQKQIAVQHDNLTKKLTEWEKTGNTEGLEVYFDVHPEKAFKIKTGEIQPSFSLSREKLMTQFPHIPEGEIDRIMTLPVAEQKQVLTKLMGELTEIRGGQGIKGMDERTALKIKYPGLTDDLLNKILIDDNPQRKAEVLATMDEFLKLREIGKSESEAFDIITKSFKKTPTKHASGGIAGELHLNEGGRIGYATGTKKFGEGQYSPTKDKAWMQTMPKIDPRLRDLIKEYKKRKGLAEILGV